MSYVNASKDIEKKYIEIKKYRARSKEEDVGGGFVKGTPNRILKLAEEVRDYYYTATHDSKGRCVM